MFKNKIVYKLTTGYMMIILISMLIIGVFFISLFRNYIFENKQKNMVKRAWEIAKVMEPILSEDTDIGEYDNFISAIDSFVNARVWVVDKEGNIVVMPKLSLDGLDEYDTSNKQLECELIGKALLGKEAIKESYSSYFQEPVLEVSVPVYDGMKKIKGAVLLCAPIASITATIDTAFIILIIIMAVLMVLTGAFSFYFSILITRPLKIMSKCAGEMTKGNYDVRTKIHQKYEVGQLAEAFDLLASKLGYTMNQLYQERNKLEDILISISEGILSFDGQMRLMNYNEAVKAQLGYDWHNALEENIIKDLQKHGLMDGFQAVMETGERKIYIREWNTKRFKFYISPVKTNSNAITGAVALIQDISESEGLEQMRKDFIANVSHELRTPLTLIRGFVEMLIDKVVYQPKDVQKYYDKALQEIKGMERLVKDLLDMSRFETEKVDLKLEKVDVTYLLLEVSRNMQAIADKKNIKIIYT